ncbi:MAG: hypothetical protein GOP50_10580 [Candidatus Heimdallarchaeota archaeon]|nr:hypothetical protein [Candidatus Heimdallarchaeota archaeon]
MLIGGLLNVSTVSAYQHLNPGDQLLYYADVVYYSDESNYYIFENELPSYYSHKDVWHYEQEVDEFHSYTVQNDYGSYTDGQRVATYFDTYRNDKGDYWDYILENWAYSGGWSDNYLWIGANSWYASYNDYNMTLNCDIPYYFGGAMYQFDEVRGYTINGMFSTYDVAVYSLHYASSGLSPTSMYNISYDYSYENYEDHYFYIDKATGFLLEYDYTYSSNSYEFFDAYADYEGIYCNVAHEYSYSSSSHYNWLLQETTAGFGGISDADLPGIEWDWYYDYTMTMGLEYLTVYFWLYDSFSTCTIDVYLNDIYVESLFGVSPGYMSYDLFVKDLPIDPYNSPKMTFVVTDDSSLGHTAIYNLHMNDERPNYPTINGPTYIEYKLGETDTQYWQLKDINYNPDYYEVKFNGLVVDSGTWAVDDYVTFNPHDYIFVEGDFELKIKATDLDGYETYLYVMIHAEDDTVPTNSTDPTGTDPTETDGSNTVTLDAPNMLFAILGVLGFVALTVLIRRRK